MRGEYIRIEYIIVIVIAIIIFLVLVRSGKKDYKINVNKLIDFLGGRDNIVSYRYTLSRFIVELKDMSLVNKEGIMKIGAKGILENGNQLKIILGTDSKELKKYIDNLK